MSIINSKDNSKTHPTVYVLIDTNIWEKERLLKSAMGAALLFAVRKLHAMIALPEVAEKEMIYQLRKVGIEAVEKIQSSFVTIQAIMGERPNCNLPSIEEIERRLGQRLVELCPLLHRSEMTLEEARSALDRVIKHTSPNQKNEQFRDSLLWEVALGLADSAAVHFITSDQAFFLDGKITNGLARDLLEELKGENREIHIHGDIASFLRSVSERIELPEPAVLSEAIDNAIRDKLLQYAQERNFSIGELDAYQVESFLTEQKDRLAITFELKYKISNILMPEGFYQMRGILQVSGDCLLNIATEEICDIDLGLIYCYGANGALLPTASTSFGRIGSVQSVPYKLRFKLKDAIPQK